MCAIIYIKCEKEREKKREKFYKKNKKENDFISKFKIQS